jgi:Flp pilus assembly protein TadD
MSRKKARNVTRPKPPAEAPAAAPAAGNVDANDPAAAHFFSAPPVTYDEELAAIVDAEPLARRRSVNPERRRRLGRVVASAVALSCAICVAAGVRVATVRAATTRVAPASEVAYAAAPPAPTEVAAASSPAPQPDPAPESPPAAEPPQATEAVAAVAPAASAVETDVEKAPVELDPAAARDAKRASQRALDRGDAKTSIEAGERAVDLDPTDAEAWLILGAAYQTRGTYPEARRCFASCVRLAKRGPRGECAALLR